MSDFEVRRDEFAMWVVRQRRTLAPVCRHIRRDDAVRSAVRCAARSGGGRVRVVLADGQHAVRAVPAEAASATVPAGPPLLVDRHTGELLDAPWLAAG